MSFRRETDIYVRRYSARDWQMIAAWAEKRGVEFEKPDRLPRFGFIAVHRHSGPISSAFLMRHEKGVPIAAIEYFVSNPDASDLLRDLSYPRLYGAIEEKARALGYEKLIASTAVLKVAQLAQSHGMTIDPMPYLFVRKLLQKGDTDERRSGSAECASG